MMTVVKRCWVCDRTFLAAGYACAGCRPTLDNIAAAHAEDRERQLFDEPERRRRVEGFVRAVRSGQKLFE